MDKLPVELLQKIFYNVIFSAFHFQIFGPMNSAVYGMLGGHPSKVDVAPIDRDRIAITQVSAWWRAVAIADARLWAVLFSPKTPRALNWVRVCLARSKAAPLECIIAPGTEDTAPGSLKVVKSFLETVEDDATRVDSLMVLPSPDWHEAPQFAEGLLSHLRAAPFKPKKFALSSGINSMARRAIFGAMGQLLSQVEELELVDESRAITRTTLHTTLRQSPELRKLVLKLASRGVEHCLTGQSISPQISLDALETLELVQCALPALSFVSPNLLHLKVTACQSRGSRPEWWKTRCHPITTPSHHEVIDSPQFPYLQTLCVNAPSASHDFLEPHAILIRAHPQVSSLYIVGIRGAEALLHRAFGTEELGKALTSPPVTPRGSPSSTRSVSPAPSGIRPPRALELLTIDIRYFQGGDVSEIPLSFFELMRYLLDASPHLQAQILLEPSKGKLGPYEHIRTARSRRLLLEQLDLMKKLFGIRWKVVLMKSSAHVEWY